MAYTNINYRTKKALKEAVKAGSTVVAWQPGPFPLTPYNGNKIVIEGPQYPEPHRWYAEATIEERDGNWVVTKVK